jgi:hypothetical protein
VGGVAAHAELVGTASMSKVWSKSLVPFSNSPMPTTTDGAPTTVARTDKFMSVSRTRERACFPTFDLRSAGIRHCGGMVDGQRLCDLPLSTRK